MTSIGDVKKRWEIHERRMTGKINTADLSYYYEPENFDRIVKAVTEKTLSGPDHRDLVPATFA